MENLEPRGEKMSDEPLPKKTLDILSKKMAFFEEGEGRPIVFLHGNPTSSYLWRKVIAELRGEGRLIAPDMIGMGDSEKLPNPGPDTYSYETHRKYIWGLIDALTRPDEKIVLVIHDWGSAIGFDWASAHPDRVSAIAYMEAILHPLDWSEWDPNLAPVFQGFRSEAGEKMILDENMFVERLLFGFHSQDLSETTKTEYRRPFLKREDRWPTLSWPRQLPISGEPPHIIEIVKKYGKWMSESDMPKLFINADPGALLRGTAREFCRTWKNQTEVTAKGRHFIQEDSGSEIGQHIKQWLQTFSQA
jgi:haloalkane dehalogenase